MSENEPVTTQTGTVDRRTVHPRAAVDIVHNFWAQVWQQPHNSDAIDDLVTEDFVITSGGTEVRGREQFKAWVQSFHDAIGEIELVPVESFQSADGSRVTSRWELTGVNRGYAGTEPDGQPVHMTGTAVWAVRADGRLEHNWVERNALEVYLRLSS
ncbi:MAG TPA: nuclear transport factor 2 family protein [Pseudonocardia sp.]|nr:nuclear transport factor 2 family protein [Pseudonocardia sp.]